MGPSLATTTNKTEQNSKNNEKNEEDEEEETIVGNADRCQRAGIVLHFLYFVG